MIEHAFGINSQGYVTQNAGTVITRFIPPRAGAFTLMRYLKYRAAATEHTLTVMNARGYTLIDAAAAASQAVFTVLGNPGDYTGKQIADNLGAANDYYAIELSDGTFHVDTLNAVASLSFTGNTNLPIALAGGEKFWLFGISTDLDPFTAAAFPAFKLEASGTTTFGSHAGDEYWFSSNHMDWPLLLYIDNGANAGKLDMTIAAYSKKGAFRTERNAGVGV